MGPWLMLPHGHPASDELGRMLGVRGIPSATVVDAMMQPQYSLDVGEAVNNALREAQRGLRGRRLLQPRLQRAAARVEAREELRLLPHLLARREQAEPPAEPEVWHGVELQIRVRHI